VFLLWLPKSIFIARHLRTEFIIRVSDLSLESDVNGSRDEFLFFGRAVERKVRVAPSSGGLGPASRKTPALAADE
jgi:hypothetical protein